MDSEQFRNNSPHFIHHMNCHSLLAGANSLTSHQLSIQAPPASPSLNPKLASGHVGRAPLPTCSNASGPSASG